MTAMPKPQSELWTKRSFPYVPMNLNERDPKPRRPAPPPSCDMPPSALMGRARRPLSRMISRLPPVQRRHEA
jgi:hypothetical protein